MQTSKLENLKRKVRRKEQPASDDPLVELRQLCQRHSALTRASVALGQMSSDKIARMDIPQRGLKKGDAIPNLLPLDSRAELDRVSDAQSKEAKKLEPLMLRCLKQLPIWKVFLSQICGMGPVTAAYLVSNIDIHKAVKPSQLRRYCGLGVNEGRADRPTKGAKLSYNKSIKTALWQFMCMGVRMAGRRTVGKYLKIWNDYKSTIRTCPPNGRWVSKPTKQQPDGGEWRREDGTIKSAGWVDATGRRKATSVFLEDLYIVWRTLEGLDVWPAFHAKQLGHFHGGKVCNNTPRKLTLDEALDLVGVSAQKAQAAE